MCLNHNCICFAVDHVEWRTDDESEAIRTLSWRYSRLDESDCGQDGQLSHCYLVMDNFRGPIWGWTDLTPALCDLLQPLQNAPPEQWSTSWWFCGLKILPTSSHYLRIATSHSKGPNEETSINVVTRVLNTAQLKMARRFRQPRWIQFRLDRWKTSCAYLQLSCVDLNPSHARFFWIGSKLFGFAAHSCHFPHQIDVKNFKSGIWCEGVPKYPRIIPNS